MEEEIKNKLSQQEELLNKIYVSTEKTRKYFLSTIIISLVLFIVPLIIMFFVLPSFMDSLVPNINTF